MSLNKSDTDIILKVKDNGTGIPDADKEKIFEPKFTTKTSGSGLGLAMVKNIVLSYGGSIHFTSEIGKGSEFTVILVHFLNK